jgi:hypothetical protein
VTENQQLSGVWGARRGLDAKGHERFLLGEVDENVLCGHCSSSYTFAQSQ